VRAGPLQSRSGAHGVTRPTCFQRFRPISAFCFFRDLGRLGTALGRLWDGSKKAESSMIARLGTVGRLGEGGVWVSPNSSLTLLLLILLHQPHSQRLPAAFGPREKSAAIRSYPQLSEPIRTLKYSCQRRRGSAADRRRDRETWRA